MPSSHKLAGREAGLSGSREQPPAHPGPSLVTLGFAPQTALEMLVFKGRVPGFSPFLSALSVLKGLLWTGLSLLHRHLHQSGALTMEALQDPPPDPMEGVEEDIADKVGPGRGPEGTVWVTQPVWGVPAQLGHRCTLGCAE